MGASPRCVGAVLARNEAAPDRYLRRVLANVACFTDSIVVLDDNSDDATPDIAAECGAIVFTRSGADGGWWNGAAAQSEAPARAQLWHLAQAEAGPEGWIYVSDCDHELLGITPAEFRRLLRSTVVDAWACPLWDCWDHEDLQRVDTWWQAWRYPRPWLFRALDGDFSPRAIHTGHAPLRDWIVGLMPLGAGIRHLSYVQPAHRQRKLERYLALQNASPALSLEATEPCEVSCPS
jgi:hypothetical protein